MNFRQAISHLENFHPHLSMFTDTCPELSGAMRVFNLESGEQLNLRSFGEYDYLYALKGNVQLLDDAGNETPLYAGDKENQRFPIPPGSKEIRIIATESTLLFQVVGDQLDYIVALKEVVDLLDPEDEETTRKAQLVRNSKVFHRLPVESIAEAIQRLKRVSVTAGEDVVTQGEKGDAYYIMEQGQADVWELGLYDDEPQKVNKLAKGDAFGEEALVMEGSRSATVRMTEDGTLLKLEKEDFDQLVKQELVEWVDSDAAQSLIDSGHQLLDVRYEEEYEEYYIPGSVLIPLQQLRQRYTELDPTKSYVAYCKGGLRSAVACMLLNQKNYNVASLRGGIMDWPHDIIRNY